MRSVSRRARRQRPSDGVGGTDVLRSWLSSLERVSPSTAELLLPGFFVRTRRRRQVGPCLAGCGSLSGRKKKHAKPARKCDGQSGAFACSQPKSARNKNLRFWCRSTSTALIAAVTRPQPPQAVQRCRTRNASAAQQAVRDRQPGAPPHHRGAPAPQATAEPELAARGAAPHVGARGEAVAGGDRTTTPREAAARGEPQEESTADAEETARPGGRSEGAARVPHCAIDRRGREFTK